MKAFTIDDGQLLRIISSLIAEEINRRTPKHIDFVTTALWREESELLSAQIGLSHDEVVFASDRVAKFFDLSSDDLAVVANQYLGDWVSIVRDSLIKKACRLTFSPAGREPNQQGCVHQTDQIFEDAAAAANLFHGRRRLLSLVAPHSLLGFVLTVITPNLQRIPSLDVRASSPAELTSALEFGDVIVATPTLWRYILEQGVTAPDNTMGVYFGEPMAPELAADMRQAGFGAQRELYGTTENGLIAWRDSPTEPYVLFDHWRRDDENLLRVPPADGARPIAPMDELNWSDNKRFNLAGRRDGAVQIGAVNIFPDKIAKALARHRDIEECVIEIRQHKGGVNRVIANIKLKPAIQPAEAIVRDINIFCRSNLRAQERPSIFHFRKDL